MPLGAVRADPAGFGLAAVLPVRQPRPSRRARLRHLRHLRHFGPRPPPAWPGRRRPATRLSETTWPEGENIMTSRPWRAAALLASAAIATLALATPASASSSWQLTDEFASNPVCYTPSGGDEPLEINLNGSWSTSLTFGASGLPAGGSYSDLIYYFASSPYAFLSTGPAPMPPGSSNGTGPFTVTANPQDFAEAYANTVITSGLQVNSSFNITLWVSDGTTKQTESVPVVIKASCKRKY
jgi:hypothetical protein